MMNFPLAAWVHHLDPFAIQFTETFGLRWYGLAYIAGFAAAFFLIRWFVRLGASELKEEQVADHITICALLGTMLGGRLGYMLLYNWDGFTANPLSFFDFLGGGMSSHGGIYGITIAAGIYASYTKKSWLGLGDNLVVVAPLGVFFGRLANFVNGELFGRKTDAAIAMKFPAELHEWEGAADGRGQWMFSIDQMRELAGRASEVAPELLRQVNDAITTAMANGTGQHFAAAERIIEASRENEAFREMLGETLNPRHPSQLYEAAAEGLIPFFVLLAIRLRWKNAWHGVITGIFFVYYAVARIIVENYREPDAAYIMGMTRGQFYSIFIILTGVAFLIYAVKTKRGNELPT
jgi:phosphatidylglycerol:prolipoprotein diacylglycerol transferase